MPDLPSGEWTPMLIGDLWPSSSALAALSNGAAARLGLSAAFSDYAELLVETNSRNLSPQQGATAEAIRGLFERGVTHCGDVAKSNDVKGNAYAAVRNRVSDLRRTLDGLAHEGNQRIDAVNASAAPLPEKVAGIQLIVDEIRAAAFTSAGACAAEISEQIHTVLAAQGVEASAHAFAAEHGVGPLIRPADPTGLEAQIGEKLKRLSAASDSDTPNPGHAAQVIEPIAPVETAPGPGQDTQATTTPSGPVLPRTHEAPQAGSDPVRALPPTPATLIAGLDGSALQAFEAAPTAADTSPGSPAPQDFAIPVIATPAPAVSAAAVAPPTPTRVVAKPATIPTPTTTRGLIGYGADLRSPVSTPTVIPAAPASAPVNTSGPTVQQTVLRQQPTGPLAPIGPTERACAAAQTQARLQRLLDAVACQMPQLRWSLAELTDGGLLLTTDLASGWIPPHVEIPSGLRLLPPGVRRTDLLCDAKTTVDYRPGRSIPRGEPVPISVRARDTAVVQDLGWELVRETRWRDGLPRLAHTLARAASARTGWLDSEVAMLGEHLSSAAMSVLHGYPGAVDPAGIGNWQLLATIEALINGETSTANYHFAWFRALSREGHR